MLLLLELGLPGRQLLDLAGPWPADPGRRRPARTASAARSRGGAGPWRRSAPRAALCRPARSSTWAWTSAMAGQRGPVAVAPRPAGGPLGQRLDPVTQLIEGGVVRPGPASGCRTARPSRSPLARRRSAGRSGGPDQPTGRPERPHQRIVGHGHGLLPGEPCHVLALPRGRGRDRGPAHSPGSAGPGGRGPRRPVDVDVDRASAPTSGGPPAARSPRRTPGAPPPRASPPARCGPPAAATGAAGGGGGGRPRGHRPRWPRP